MSHYDEDDYGPKDPFAPSATERYYIEKKALLAEKDAEIAELKERLSDNVYETILSLKEQLRASNEDIAEWKHVHELAKDQITKQQEQLVAAQARIEYNNGCFDAAYFEGLSEALESQENKEVGSLYDLVTRRLLYTVHERDNLTTLAEHDAALLEKVAKWCDYRLR